MKYIILTIITIANLLLFSKVYSQNTMPQVIPPSPNAASLGIFGDIPVSHYTGIPNINIPLYEVVSGNIHVPIQLQYHASGIKVSQEASWVGLGWALNAGGVITRTVRGWDDFEDYGIKGFIQSDALPNCRPDNVPVYSYDKETQDKYRLYAWNQIDSEPDLFYYNFGKYSGKLVIPKQKLGKSGFEAISLNGDEVKFEASMAGYNWVATTPDGIKYYFGTRERTTVGSENTSTIEWHDQFLPRENQATLVTSWYLDSIRCQNDVVKFIYTLEHSRTESQIQTSYFNATRMQGSGTGYSQEKYAYNRTMTNDVYLKEIIFRNGSVKFETKNRNDLLYSKQYSRPQCLNSISVKNNTEEILSYSFEYSLNGGSSDNTLFMRQFLKEIKDNSGKLHSFEYEPLSVAKNSTSIDHWGYYNGKSNSSHGLKRLPTYVSAYITNNGADRNAYNGFTQAGVLRQINYPTGGFTRFQYQTNEYSFSGSNSPEDPYTILPTRYAFYEYANDTLNFQLINKAKILWKVTIVAKSPTTYPPCAESGFHSILQNKKNGVWRSVEENWYTEITCNIREGEYIEHNFSKQLEEGEYRIILYPRKGIDVWLDFKAPQKSLKLDSDDSESQSGSVWFTGKGGGLRIEKIIHNDGKNTQTTSYEYTKTNDDGEVLSSGKLMSSPRYFRELRIKATEYIWHHKTETEFTYPDLSELQIRIQEVFLKDVVSWYASDGEYLIGYSDSMTPLGSFSSGNSVGYDRVVETVKSTDGKENGKTVYYFHNKPEEVEEKYWLPGVPNQANFKNGLMYKKEYFDANDKLLKEENNTYGYDWERTLNVKGLKLFNYLNISDFTCLGMFYDTKYDWWYLVRDEIVSYDESNNILKVTNEYTYDNTTYKRFSKRSTILSDGSSLTVEYKYPYDFSDNIYQVMTDKNMITPLIEEKVFKNDIFISSTKTEYRNDWPNAKNILAPSSMKTQNRNQIYPEERLIYHSYDYFGNPTHISKDDATHIIYLWSYGGQYPIAEIKNATYEDVKGALGWNDNYINALSNQMIPSETDRKKINDLRLNVTLKNAAITTYTYKPLVGMLTSTDPRGVTTYYEYDDFGRLKWIKDHNGKKIEEYDYNYSNK